MNAPPPSDVLRRILEQRRRTLSFDPPEEGSENGSVLASSEAPFSRALAKSRGRAVIAEVKMGSPRLGSLVGRVDPLKQAAAYRDGGAAALSVVVEPHFFHGSYALLERCRAESGLPAVAKDFVVSRRQLDRAAEVGAGAVLLIAALYSAAELRAWAGAARRRGLVPLIETHGRSDLERLAGRSWELVGVNNRDLTTFEVDLEHSIRMQPSLPEGSLTVAESGIREPEEVDRLRRAGFDAFLIGEALLQSDDPRSMLERLIGG